MLEGMVDGQRREDDVALLHVLHGPAGTGLLQGLAGRGGRAQVLADVLSEPGAPAHLQDAVVVLGLDAHLLVHLPLAVVGQVAAGDLHGREPQQAEHVGSVGGELQRVHVAQLLQGGQHGLSGYIDVGGEIAELDPHGLGREEVHDQGDGYPVGRAAGHGRLQALHALQKERVRGHSCHLCHLSSPPGLSSRLSRRLGRSCSTRRRPRRWRWPRLRGRRR